MVSRADVRREVVLVGLGPSPHLITLAGLTEVADADCVFLDTYTSAVDRSEVEAVLGRPVVPLTRRDLEDMGGEALLRCGKSVLLVGGDPLMATAHGALVASLRARGVLVRVVPGVSIITAALGAACLSPYKLGGVATVTYPRLGVLSERPYEVVEQALSRGMHSVLLLDVADDGGFMPISDAARILLTLEARIGRGIFKPERLVVAISRLGMRGESVDVAPLGSLPAFRREPPSTLIVPGSLNLVEAECLSQLM